jgi:transposase-like protein
MRARRYRAEERQAHVAAWRASGLSQLRYAREHGLGKTTLQKWIARSNRIAPRPKRKIDFVPVIVRQAATTDTVQFDNVHLRIGAAQLHFSPLSASQLQGLLSILETRAC